MLITISDAYLEEVVEEVVVLRRLGYPELVAPVADLVEVEGASEHEALCVHLVCLAHCWASLLLDLVPEARVSEHGLMKSHKQTETQ